MYIPDDLNKIAESINSGGDWRLYIQQLMDDIRRNPKEYYRIFKEKPKFNDIKVYAMFQALTRHYAHEYNFETPEWAKVPEYLKEPWFPSGIENLKAMCILESPFEFRRNNIFVLKNFLDRV